MKTEKPCILKTIGTGFLKAGVHDPPVAGGSAAEIQYKHWLLPQIKIPP